MKAGIVWAASVLVLVFLPVIVVVPYVVYKLVAGGPVAQKPPNRSDRNEGRRRSYG